MAMVSIIRGDLFPLVMGCTFLHFSKNIFFIFFFRSPVVAPLCLGLFRVNTVENAFEINLDYYLIYNTAAFGESKRVKKGRFLH